ncbi:MAG: glycosyltransferase [Candidatus Kapabacteria bacterium]|jgi:glycosyltransferase involved in cell wall biosynthesis|nr:glycosyltransferase [Candidatus Kapabacteria bacterium]
MNIAFIIHNQAETGPYWKVLEQCTAYVKLGHQATIFATSKTERRKTRIVMRDGVRVVEAPDLLWGKLRQGVDIWNALQRCRLARRLHKEQAFDVVHAVDCRPNVIIPALYMQRRLKMPFILSWWDLFGKGSTRFGKAFAMTVGMVEGWLETGFRKYADGATTITTFLAKRLEDIGYPKDRIEVHHLGVDTSQEPLEYSVARTWLREQCGIGTEERVLCFAGTIYDADFTLLLKALDILQARNIAYKLVWVGKHVIADDVCEKYHIHRTGIVPTMEEVYRYFAAADACILPMEVNDANAARWHSKTTDYLNAGAPVVLTPVSDFPRYFSAHSIGWLAESGSPEDFAKALETALSVDLETRTAIGNNAREFMRRELDVMTIAARALRFYQRFTSS